MGPYGSKTSGRTKIFMGKAVLHQITLKDMGIEGNV